MNNSDSTWMAVRRRVSPFYYEQQLSIEDSSLRWTLHLGKTKIWNIQIIYNVKKPLKEMLQM